MGEDGLGAWIVDLTCVDHKAIKYAGQGPITVPVIDKEILIFMNENKDILAKASMLKMGQLALQNIYNAIQAIISKLVGKYSSLYLALNVLQFTLAIEMTKLSLEIHNLGRDATGAPRILL